jgi:hypothetical protein
MEKKLTNDFCANCRVVTQCVVSPSSIYRTQNTKLDNQNKIVWCGISSDDSHKPSKDFKFW